MQYYLESPVVTTVLNLLAASLIYRLFIPDPNRIADQLDDTGEKVPTPTKRSLLFTAGAITAVPFISGNLTQLISFLMLNSLFGSANGIVSVELYIVIIILLFGLLQRLLPRETSVFVAAAAFICIYPWLSDKFTEMMLQAIKALDLASTESGNYFFNFWEQTFSQGYRFATDNRSIEGVLALTGVSLLAAVAAYLIVRLLLPLGLRGDTMLLRRSVNASGWNGLVISQQDNRAVRRSDWNSRDDNNQATFNSVTVLLVSSAIVILSFIALALIGQGFKPIPVVIGTLLSILLASLPILVSHGQSTSRERQLRRLESLADHPVSQTAFYRAAHATLMSLQTVSLDRMYSIPLAALATILVFGFLAIFLAIDAGDIFKMHSFMLGGAAGIGLEDGELDKYQRGTFLALSMSFLGSYVYMLFSLIFRVQNNDIHPMAFYSYTVRMVISCIVAIVLRHAATLFGSQFESFQVIVLLGFIVGFAPDLFIAAMAKKAFQLVKIIGSQPDPSPEDLPTNQNLLMIEGMSRDKIDRLSELGIDSAQYLACQNPFLVWLRLPFDLSLVVDWIAQAQLYRLAKEVRVKSMRGVGINNIFDFYEFLVSGRVPQPLLGVISINADAIPNYRANLEEDPSFTRLQAVRRTMRLAGVAISAEHMSPPQQIGDNEAPRGLLSVVETTADHR